VLLLLLLLLHLNAQGSACGLVACCTVRSHVVAALFCGCLMLRASTSVLAHAARSLSFATSALMRRRARHQRAVHVHGAPDWCQPLSVVGAAGCAIASSRQPSSSYRLACRVEEFACNKAPCSDTLRVAACLLGSKQQPVPDNRVVWAASDLPARQRLGVARVCCCPGLLLSPVAHLCALGRLLSPSFLFCSGVSLVFLSGLVGAFQGYAPNAS
jgi:hypothetical protein